MVCWCVVVAAHNVIFHLCSLDRELGILPSTDEKKSFTTHLSYVYGIVPIYTTNRQRLAGHSGQIITMSSSSRLEKGNNVIFSTGKKEINSQCDVDEKVDGAVEDDEGV